MNEYMEIEREIDLKDLLYRVLKSWRAILVGAIVLAVVLGAFQLIRGLPAMKDTAAVEAAQEEYSLALSTHETTGKRLSSEIDYLQRQSFSQQEYNDKSTLMKIDPMEKWTGELRFDIELERNEGYQSAVLTNRLLSAYLTYLQSDEFCDEMLARFPAVGEARFLKELYSAAADPDAAAITLRCSGKAEAEARQMLEQIKTQLAARYETIRSEVGEHGVSFSGEAVTCEVDLELAEAQKNNLEAVTDYAAKLKTKENELASWEKEAVPEPEYGTKSVVKKTIKYFVLGAVGGAVLMYIWFAGKYALSSTVKTDDDWKLYQVPVLGRIIQDEKKKKFLPGLDTLIDRWFGRTRTLTEAQSCALAAQSLGAALAARGLDGIALVGRLPEGKAEELTQKLNAAGTKATYRYAGDVLTDPATVQALEDGKEVLLLAERYATSFADVEQTLTLLKAWGKSVLGVVVVE